MHRNSCVPSITIAALQRMVLHQSLDDVTDLNYCCRGVASLGDLTVLTELKRLSLAFNVLGQLQGIPALTALQVLDVSHNNLVSLDPLTDLRMLSSLNAGCNRIVSTAPLVALQELRSLALHANQLARPSTVLALRELTALTVLTLTRNPLCAEPAWRAATIRALPWLQVQSAGCKHHATRCCMHAAAVAAASPCLVMRTAALLLHLGT